LKDTSNLSDADAGKSRQLASYSFVSNYVNSAPWNWNPAVPFGVSENALVTITPLATWTFTGVPGITSGSIVGYDTTVNTVSDRQRQEFWRVLALSISQLTLRGNYATNTWVVTKPGEVASSGDLSTVVWGTLLMKAIDYHTKLEPEQEDIINLIGNSVLGSAPENPISPRNLLRACAVGASIADSLAHKPHIYAAPGGRVVLDYALTDGRFTAVVTDAYIHLLGTIHGQFHERTVEKEEYDLLELKNWVRSR
jgi:hypothetical protein